jgi:hypothetical protein
VLGRLFGRKKPDPQPGGAGSATRTIDPALHARAKATADLIGPGIMGIASGERGVHVESMFVALGAVAGYGCQIAARLAPPQVIIADPGRTPWAEARGADGKTYYFGDAPNHYLLEAPDSFWNVAAGIIGQIGTQPVPDHREIAAHVAATVGGPEFGAIRFPPGTSAAHAPWDYLTALWPEVRVRLDQGGLAPTEWPVGFGITAQIALLAAEEIIEPAAGLAITMEAAVAMAKVDPSSLGLRAD